ncbi:MAG: zinc ribbon domain-containing protein [Deltaproteobacteria bacterium]|nr:zinc ribbon domain-containing protein [Deltaproteobacteria bacterium]
MPIYEYLCSACGEEFEAMQKFSDSPLDTCEACGKKGRVARKISLSAFQLKGGGWYNQGYNGGAGGSSGSGGASASSGDGGGSGEAKSSPPG